MSDQASAPQNDTVDRLSELQAMRFGTDALPLEHFRGMTDEAIRAHYGIGPRTCQQIRGFLAELEELAPAPPPAPEPAAEPAAAPVASEADGAAPGGGLGLLLTLVAVLLVIVLAVVFATQRGGGGAALQEANLRIGTMQGTLAGIKRDGATAATAQARKVLDSAHVGNFGDALSQLDDVERTLLTIELAERGNGAATDEKGAATGPLAGAKAALGAARAALSLEKPATKVDVEAACTKLCEALGPLSPKDEATHGEASQQAEH